MMLYSMGRGRIVTVTECWQLIYSGEDTAGGKGGGQTVHPWFKFFFFFE